MNWRAAAAQPVDSVVSACRNSSHGALPATAPSASCRPRPGSLTMTAAPACRAMVVVSSREPPSHTVTD